MESASAAAPEVTQEPAAGEQEPAPESESISAPESAVESAPAAEPEGPAAPEPAAEQTPQAPAAPQSAALQTIYEQEMGEAVFYPGQTGTFALADPQNESFRTAAQAAGYVELGVETEPAALLAADAPSADAASFTAKLYDSGLTDSAACTELTEAGAAGRPWDYNKAERSLVIDATFAGNGGTIAITLPTGMALYNTNYTKAGGAIESVSFAPLTGAGGTGGQGAGTLKNANTGTLTYTFSAAAIKEQLKIPVTFDQTIWNKNAGTHNLAGDKAPITVTMTANGAVSTKTISQVSASINYETSGTKINTAYSPKVVELNKSGVSMSYVDIRNVATYWQSVTVEYILPKNKNGSGNARYEAEPANPPVSTYTKADKVDSSDPTKVVYTWENCNFGGYLFLAPQVTFPADVFSDGETATGEIHFTGVSYSGEKIDRNVLFTTVVKEAKAELTLSGVNIRSYYPLSYPAEVQSLLGQFRIQNAGLAATAENSVKIEFDSAVPAGTDAAPNLQVTAFALPQVKVDFTAACTLVNADNTETVSQEMLINYSNDSKKTSDRLAKVLLAREVATAAGKDNPDEWYLKEISYTLGAIPAATTLFVENATHQFIKSDQYISGGNFYGRWNSGKYSDGEFVKSTITATGLKPLTVTTVKPQDNPTTAQSPNQRPNTMPLYISEIAPKSSSVTAGGTANLTIGLSMHYYPYATTQYARNPVLYFIAPPGVSLTAGDVSTAWSDSSADAIGAALTSRTLDTGETIYKIALLNAAFGGPTLRGETLLSAYETRHPVVTLHLNTSAGMSPTTIALQKSVFVTEADGNIFNTPTLYTEDIHDLDNDGDTKEYVGCVDSTQNPTFTIAANTNKLSFTTQAKMGDEPDTDYRSGSAPANRLYVTEETDAVSYRLKLENKSGGIVAGNSFYYYVPIPKKGAALPGGMGAAVPTFGFTLAEAAELSGSNSSIYDVRYSTDATADNYDNGKASFDSTGGKAVWRTAAEITAANAWADVAMVKLLIREGIDSVPKDTVDYFDFAFKFQGTAADIIAGAGDSLIWHANGGLLAEDQKFAASPSDDVAAMLRYELRETLTLTAAYNRAPTAPAVNKIVVTSPKFSTAKKLSILSVTTDNVVLQPSATVTKDQATATSSVANSSFAITAKMGAGAALELSGACPQSLGTLAADTQETLTFELFNYNAINEADTPRSVTVVIGDESGAELTVTIAIARELTRVSDPKTSIEGGKFYELLSGSVNQVSITQNSAVTAQYQYTLTGTAVHTLQFYSGDTLTAFPDGTTIVFIDSSTIYETTTPYAPQYYYYKVSGTATSAVALTSFTQMNGTGNFTEPPAAGDKKLAYNFIVDFGAGGGRLAAGSYQLRLNVAAGASSTNMDFAITAAAARTFSLTAANAAAMGDGSLAVTGTADTGGVTGSDSRWDNHKMFLAVTLRDTAGNKLDFPAGALITMGGKKYVPASETILLPLETLGKKDYSYVFSTPYAALTDKASYVLHTELMVSATTNAAAPMGGTKAASADGTVFTVNAPPVYAISFALTDAYADKQLLTKAEAGIIPFAIQYNDAVRNSALTMEVQKKVGEVYLTQTNLIDKVVEAGSDVLPNAAGVITRPALVTGNTVSADLYLKTANLAVEQTYRILIKTSGIGETRTIVYNFIIVE